MKVEVCAADAMKPGEKRAVALGARTVVLCRTSSGYYAVSDNCPHQGASMAKGALGGTALPSRPGEYVYGHDNEILSCPWHAYEFDVTTGASVFRDPKMRLACYPVTIENGQVFVESQAKRRAQARENRG
jgi:nitrite reductase (NADH) small subunit